MAVQPAARRAQTAVTVVLPRAVQILRTRESEHTVELVLNGHRIQVEWLGEGGLRQIRQLIARQENRPDIVTARRLSPGAKDALSAAGIG